MTAKNVIFVTLIVKACNEEHWALLVGMTANLMSLGLASLIPRTPGYEARVLHTKTSYHAHYSHKS